MQSYIWEDHPIVDEHPYFGDESNYFPTVKQMVEQSYSLLEVDPAKKNASLLGEELFFGLHKVEVTDTNIIPS